MQLRDRRKVELNELMVALVPTKEAGDDDQSQLMHMIGQI
jgi:hypothetical protein